jgi:hypothetical protein
MPSQSTLRLVPDPEQTEKRAPLSASPPALQERVYGTHAYSKGPHEISMCEYRCGCWSGRGASGGHIGLDASPFGECPNSPLPGSPEFGRDGDYEYLVAKRLETLEKALRETREKLANVLSRSASESPEEFEKHRHAAEASWWDDYENR